MPRVQLVRLAHARSGDKGDTANIGVIAYRPEDFPLLAGELTAERVQRHLAPLGTGRVERFDLPKLFALNFLIGNALGGGGTISLRNDSQGKVLSNALLRLEIEVPEAVANACADFGLAPGANLGLAPSAR